MEWIRRLPSLGCGVPEKLSVSIGISARDVEQRYIDAGSVSRILFHVLRASLLTK